MRFESDELGKVLGSIKQRGFRALIGALIIVVVIDCLLSTWVYVKASEAGVVTRAGAVIAEYHQPGFHGKLPWPIDDAETVNISEVRQFTLDGSTEPDQENPPPIEMLTRDTGIVLFKCNVQYQVSSGTNWLIENVDPEGILKSLSMYTLRRTSGKYEFYELSLSKRTEAQDWMKQTLQTLAEEQKLGITITGIQIQDAHPPAEVQGEFGKVQNANEAKGGRISEAQKVVNSILPEARGTAQEWKNGATAEATKIINNAKAEVAVFNELEEQYRLNPQATWARMVLETNEQALAGKKRIVDYTGTQNYRTFGNR